MDAVLRNRAIAFYRALPRDGRLPGNCSMDVPGDLRGKRVIDVLCRKGKGAFRLSDSVGESGFVLGVDPDECFVRDAVGRAANNHWSAGLWERYLRFAVAFPEDLLNAGVADASFDLVYINSAFNCVFDRRLALAEFARCLKPGGCLWIAQGVFCACDGDSALRSADNSCSGNVFEHALSPSALTQLCLDAGFRSVRFLGEHTVAPDGADASALTAGQSFLQATVCACC